MSLPLLSSEVLQWILAGGVAVGVTIVLEIVRRLLLRRLAKLSAGTSNRVDDIILEVARKTRFWFLLVVGLGIGAGMLALPDKAALVVRIVTFSAIALQIGLWATALLDGVVTGWLATEHRAGVSRNTMGAARLLGRGLIWSVLLLLVLDNAGVNITTLIAGLGIGGVAVALATQNILGDLFSSLSIVLDKPFEVGDAIVVDEYSGTVEHIGLKTTRLRATSGEQLIFSNSNLLSSRIRNYRRMSERRIDFTIGITYDSDPDKIEAVVALLKDVIGSRKVRFERAHFKGFGELGLTFEAVYHVLTPDYNEFMDTQQAINLGLLKGLDALGVEMAFKPRAASAPDQPKRDNAGVKVGNPEPGPAKPTIEPPPR